ncbi:MAG: TetR/AcrR family transcriptional regulator [Candidatus Marinimicrobia bacterium]|nr:TetR/AcrR family transcriptional regulator [FCB group bacterium]MBL7024943.1 TetR/AcrR family transcriptional regulator [Candidatus Neomarinimicrobiota bacterium]
MPLQLYEKEKILDACFEVFILHGYAKTSTAMLAEAAGISKALIFHHFESKKKLYISILERCLDKMTPELNQESPAEYGDFFEAKEQNGLKRIDYLRKNPKLNRILFEAFYSTPDELKLEIHQLKSLMDEKYGAMNAEKERQMMKLFNKISLREGVDSREAYELLQVVSEYFRMKLATELTETKKMHDDGYWKDFFAKKNSFLEMVRFGIEAHT